MECIDKDRDQCEGPVVFGPDPYEYDLNGDDTPVWLCERHADDRAMEL